MNQKQMRKIGRSIAENIIRSAVGLDALLRGDGSLRPARIMAAQRHVQRAIDELKEALSFLEERGPLP